jgi:hypothetical protein
MQQPHLLSLRQLFATKYAATHSSIILVLHNKINEWNRKQKLFSTTLQIFAVALVSTVAACLQHLLPLFAIIINKLTI